MDIETIFALIDKAQASLFDNIEIETQDLKLRLQRQPMPSSTNTQATDEIQTMALTAGQDEKEDTPAPEELVHAPISGVFYRRRDPDAEPFVEIGQRVYKGQPLCIIEAMKMMNEITAPKSGVIEYIYPEDNEPITAGDALFAYAKEG